MRRSAAALAAFLTMLVLAAPAGAVPDGPLDAYLDHVDLLEGAPLELAWPASGTVTDGFGPRWGRMHLGIDVGVLTSLEITAAGAGTVLETGYLPGYSGYGNVVTVDVGEGMTMLYAHLAAVDVHPGQWLDRGERIGTAGCTGSCTGTHLHFELREAGIPVDPAPFLLG
jgi:murein DD-endopeptidase MepM/ murein hydrolase activator NlpD